MKVQVCASHNECFFEKPLKTVCPGVFRKSFRQAKFNAIVVQRQIFPWLQIIWSNKSPKPMNPTNSQSAAKVSRSEAIDALEALMNILFLAQKGEKDIQINKLLRDTEPCTSKLAHYLEQETNSPVFVTVTAMGRS